MNQPISFTELRPTLGMGTQSLLALIASHRATREGTALASAARTSTTISSTITNHDSVGILVFLRITVASGTGGLRPFLLCRHPTSGGLQNAHSNLTTRTTATIFLYTFHPAITSLAWNVNHDGAAVVVPRQFAIQVEHLDASSYTYSVDYCLLP